MGANAATAGLSSFSPNPRPLTPARPPREPAMKLSKGCSAPWLGARWPSWLSQPCRVPRTKARAGWRCPDPRTLHHRDAWGRAGRESFPDTGEPSEAGGRGRGLLIGLCTRRSVPLFPDFAVHRSRYISSRPIAASARPQPPRAPLHRGPARGWTRTARPGGIQTHLARPGAP